MEPIVPCRLVVEQGDHPGMIFPLRANRVSIGRGPESTLQIIDTRISRVHVQLECKEGGWTVVDLRSKNGTLVNDQPIATEVRLRHGDTIHVGSAVLLFETEKSAAKAQVAGRRRAEVQIVPEDTSLHTSHILPLTEEDFESSVTGVRRVPEDADERLHSILQVGKLMQTILDLDELLDKIMEVVVRVLEPTNSCILLYNEETGDLEPRVIHSPGDDSKDVKISGSILAQALEDKVAVVMGDSKNDDRFKSSESVLFQLIHSAICVPFIAKGQVRGALYLDTRDQSKAYNERDLAWAGGIASQAALAIESALLHRQMIAKHENERELQVARSIQMNLLPKAMPVREGLEFGGLSEPARMVGGDYYDFIDLPEEALAIAIADVSGKGVPSAILLASLRAAVKNQARNIPEAGIIEVVDQLNEIVCEDTMTNMFVTMVLGYLEPAVRRFTYVNAGHVYPILRRPDGEIRELESNGPFLGVMPGVKFEKGSVELHPGSLLVLLSDGVTDAFNPEREAYEKDRIIQFVHNHYDRPAQTFCDELRAEVREFQGAAEQFDDFTLVAIKSL